MSEPILELWDDSGPISQGKILTAVMKEQPAGARDMLRGWTAADLLYLASSCDRLARMARVEVTWKKSR